MTVYNCLVHGIVVPLGRNPDNWRCPRCADNHQAQVPPLRAEEPAPTLSPEAQAVLEWARGFRNLWKNLDFKVNGVDADKFVDGATSLCCAVDAWHATLSPKDYAPDELKPGQRFRFADDPLKVIWKLAVVQDAPETSCRMAMLRDQVCLIPPGTRLIPTTDQERDTKW